MHQFSLIAAINAFDEKYFSAAKFSKVYIAVGGIPFGYTT